MFEQKGNVFVAYGLDNKGTQSLGKMEKIVIDTITINEIRRLLSQGKILNAASIIKEPEPSKLLRYIVLIPLMNLVYEIRSGDRVKHLRMSCQRCRLREI